MELAVDLVEWAALSDGTTIRLWADGYSREAGELVFTALVRGAPNRRVVLARIPEAQIDQVRGG
jgi:hypothetical protein